MIIVQLSGDSGNQMFQYALGRRLSLIHQTELKLDIADFENRPDNYKLDRFNIRASVADKKDVSQLVNLHYLRNAQTTQIDSAFFSRQTNIESNPYLVTLRDNTYLTGECLNLAYIATIAPLLRRELRVKTTPVGLNKKYLRQIAKQNSICVYLYRNNNNDDKLPALSLDYYYRAVEHLANKIKKPVFYLFSNDPAWCQNNFSINYPSYYVSHNNDTNSFEDFRLMTNCKHHIIANSTFAWWSAWLNNNKRKIVISPDPWFSDITANEDFIPQKWVRFANE